MANCVPEHQSMARVRFCSECGEQIKARRASLLPFGPLCSECAPGYRRARLALVASVILCAAIIFAIARLTAPREPLYFIGTPLDLNSRRDTATTNQNVIVPSVENNVAQREQSPVSSSAVETTCGAPTKSGRPCKRKVKGGGYCWQHRDKFRANSANDLR